MHNLARRFLAFDVETSGLGSSARVLELGVVEFVNGCPEREKTWLFGPTDVDWEDPKIKEALAINKLNTEELKRSPEFGTALAEVVKAFDWAPVWVAHNSPFDLRMLDSELARAGSAPKRPSGPVVCTMSLDYYYNRETSGWKLQEVAARHGVKVAGELHRAATDALIAGYVFLQLVSRLPEEPDHANALCEDMRRVWASSRKKRRR